MRRNFLKSILMGFAALLGFAVTPAAKPSEPSYVRRCFRRVSHYEFEELFEHHQINDNEMLLVMETLDGKTTVYTVTACVGRPRLTIQEHAIVSSDVGKLSLWAGWRSVRFTQAEMDSFKKA